ncbi:uncharacterized protein [Blastocystis hominis]|uniref:Uncharacterized protein n=1 Tax=Blastocystis hominis TaxID=12968 RepID=D8M1N2_BLAHO|nr:uncharacterized protein [Blastocystis hominis]CBK21971.2 unnamed protein product [Blastocystis hominis]|eukprot:XP_012896019.1 uncharacterized protein [Blastocystis hominis]
MFLNNDESLNKSNQIKSNQIKSNQIKSNQINIIDLMLDFDKISENGRNIYKSNQINQTILEIDFDRTYRNNQDSLTFRRFGISKYYQYSIFRNTCQCHYTRIIEAKSNRCY